MIMDSESNTSSRDDDQIIRDFVSRGLVILTPEQLGISADIHSIIYAKEKELFSAKKMVTANQIPEMLDVINSPGVVTTCNLLLGQHWAIVPYTHNAPFPSGSNDQHWHKDDNGPYNGRKQRHHHAVQVELLYYPQDVLEDMGPTAIVPYSQYWTFNHEENHENFAGADHLDFGYQLNGMERIPISGPKSFYDPKDIVHPRTDHDVRMRDAITNTGWPLVETFEASPLRAGSVVLYSHNLFHRGNHRRDDWTTWKERPRFMWRFWLFRTTDPDEGATSIDQKKIQWAEPSTDALTSSDLSKIDSNVTTIWSHHYHWIRRGETPAYHHDSVPFSGDNPSGELDQLRKQLHLLNESAEPQRMGAAYRLAEMPDQTETLGIFVEALYSDRESVRRAATHGLVALGDTATPTFLEATKSDVKWIRKAGAFGLGDAGHLNQDVLDTLIEVLLADPSIYVRSVAAGALGCLGRRSAASDLGEKFISRCLDALIQSLKHEVNRLGMDRAQSRSIKFVRPTDECDICEGIGINYGIERFEPVRSAVRENALWSAVVLCSHPDSISDATLDSTIAALSDVVETDKNIFCVGFAMDALIRLAPSADSRDLSRLERQSLADLVKVLLAELPLHSAESFARARLSQHSDRGDSP